MSKKSTSGGSDSLAKLGFNDEEKLQKFLAHPSNKFVQKRFDEIFPPVEKKFTSASELAGGGGTRTNAKSPVISQADGPDELDLGAELDLGGGEEVMSTSDDKELELGGEELSFGEDSPAESAPLDEGLDLSLDAGLDLGGEDALTDEPDAPSGEGTLTTLKLGSDMNLDDDVMSKLAEIDKIMEEDATNASRVRPAELSADDNGTDDDLGGLDLGGDDLGSDDGLSLGGDDDLLAGGDDLGVELGGDDLLSAPELGDDGDDLLASGTSSQLTEPNDIGDGLELGGDDEAEDLFASSAALESSAPKKALPTAPDLGDADEEDGLSFSMEDVSEPIIAAPKKADRTAELPIPEGFGKKKEPQIERMNDGHVMADDDVPLRRSSAEERSSYKEVVGNYNHELERLQATMNHLKADRNDLLKRIEQLEEDKQVQNRHVLGMRAELDEKKIEVQLLKKRMTEEGQDLKYQLELELERRKLAEERARAYQTEAQTLQQKVKMEVKKVSSRERELEQKLELLKADAETQIRHRDLKILELKRRIDSMEFDMESMNALEQKSVGDKQELETKLDKAIKTLRTAIGILETDDPKLATLEKLKKNLEV